MNARLEELLRKITPELTRQAREALPVYLREQFDENAIITIMNKNRPICNLKVGNNKDCSTGLTVIISMGN